MKSYSTALRNEFYRSNVFSADLIEIHLPTPRYLCSGAYNISVDTPTAPNAGVNVYTAQGDFLGFNGITEDFEVKVGKISLYISGLSTLGDDFTNPDITGKRVVIYRVFLNLTTGAVVDTPIMLFDGQIQNVSMTEAARSASITLDVASIFADFERVAGRMTNNESNWFFQGRRFDTIFEKTGMLKSSEIKWGRL